MGAMKGEKMPSGWFGSKRVGWGVRPASWQGWAVTLLYLAVASVLARTLVTHHVALFIAALVVLTAAYVVIAGLASGPRR